MEGPFQVAVPGTHQALLCLARGVISGLPARDNETGATPQGDGTVSAHQPAPLCRSGRQKGGVAPVLLKMPRSARPSRELDSNCNGHSRLEKSVRARRKTAFVHMPPVVPCALPDRHETSFFSGQYQAPANRFGWVSVVLPNGADRPPVIDSCQPVSPPSRP